MTDMIPRAEADALVAKRQKEIEAVVGLMEPYVNSVEQVTMRVMFAEYYHGAKFINVIGRRDGVEKRFEADWLKHLPRALADAVNEATKLTVPIAALDAMLAEARREERARALDEVSEQWAAALYGMTENGVAALNEKAASELHPEITAFSEWLTDAAIRAEAE